MPVKVRDQGDYELFETNHGHRILVLNGKRWYAWVRGQRGEILVHSDSDHVKDHTCGKGKFYVVDFEQDPKFKDMPHLFLQSGDRYDELMIPNGLPTEGDPQKKIVRTDESLPREKLESYLKHPRPAGPGEERMESTREEGPGPDLPIQDYDRLTVDEITDQLDELSEEELEQIARYERRHKNRKTLMEALDSAKEHAHAS